MAENQSLLSALKSLLSQKRGKKYLSMTGEMTLRGKLLPVGGIKEKILAAKRSKIKEIILSKSNKKDVDEINSKYTKGLKFHFLSHIDEVIDIAITDQKTKKNKKIKNL